MNKTAKRILYVVIILVVLALLAYPKLPKTSKEAPEMASAAANTLTVDAIVAVPEPLKYQINITGSLLADEAVSLNSEVAGKVERIHFNEGQKVQKGQLLITLNDDELRAELEKQQFTKKLNEDNEFRQKQLLEKEAISREEHETALNTLNTTQAEIKALTARLEKYSIRAPFSGTVGLRGISEGSYLNPGDEIARLYKTNPIKVEFAVPSKYLQLVDTGDEITFGVDAYSETFAGSIYAIEPQIDPQTRSIRVRAHAQNPSDKLLPGQFARITLLLETIPQALLIPSEAVIPELNGKKVFLYRSGKVESLRIETDIRTEHRVQVVSGLQEGDTVITTGILQLSQGDEVNVNLN